MRICIILLLTLVCSCTSAQGKDEQKNKSEDITFTRLFPVENWNDAHIGLDFTPEDAQRILIQNQCNISAQQQAQNLVSIPAVVISALVSSGIKLAVKAIDTKLQKQLKDYSAEYTAVYSGKWPSTKCWRMVKAIRNAEKSTDEILFDALFVMTPDSDATLVQPLRVAMYAPTPKKPTKKVGKYGVALTVSIRSSTKDGFAKVAEGLVMKKTLVVQKEQNKVIEYFGLTPKTCNGDSSDPDSKDSPRTLYCDYSSSNKFISAIDLGSKVEVTATVAEIAEPPKFLEIIAEVFSGASEDVGEALAEIAAAKINPKEE